MRDAQTDLPQVAVLDTGSEMSRCNRGLRRQTQAVANGIHVSGGFPHELPVASVSDGRSSRIREYVFQDLTRAESEANSYAALETEPVAA